MYVQFLINNNIVFVRYVQSQWLSETYVTYAPAGGYSRPEGINGVFVEKSMCFLYLIRRRECLSLGGKPLSAVSMPRNTYNIIHSHTNSHTYTYMQYIQIHTIHTHTYTYMQYMHMSKPYARSPLALLPRLKGSACIKPHKD